MKEHSLPPTHFLLLLRGNRILERSEHEGPATTPFGDKYLHILTVIARA